MYILQGQYGFIIYDLNHQEIAIFKDLNEAVNFIKYHQKNNQYTQLMNQPNNQLLPVAFQNSQLLPNSNYYLPPQVQNGYYNQTPASQNFTNPNLINNKLDLGTSFQQNPQQLKNNEFLNTIESGSNLSTIKTNNSFTIDSFDLQKKESMIEDDDNDIDVGFENNKKRLWLRVAIGVLIVVLLAAIVIGVIIATDVGNLGTKIKQIIGYS